MRKNYVLFLKAVLILFGVGLLAFAVFLLPKFAEMAANYYTELRYLKIPGLIFVYCTAVPFYIALFRGVRICDTILQSDPFSRKNRKAFTIAGVCALIVALMYYGGTLALVFLQVDRLIIYIVGVLIGSCALIFTLLCAVLDQLLAKAIEIREENDLTV